MRSGATTRNGPKPDGSLGASAMQRRIRHLRPRNGAGVLIRLVRLLHRPADWHQREAQDGLSPPG